MSEEHPTTIPAILPNDEPNISRITLIKQEIAWILPSTIPMSLTFLCLSSFNFASLLTVGRLGVNELAGVSLGIMLANFLVLMPGFGVATTLDSFCYAAFTASEDKTQVGFHTRRGLITITILLIPIMAFFMYIDPLLVMMGQTPEVARICGQFLRIWMLGSWPQLAFDCLRRFILAQGAMQAGTWIMVMVVPIHMYNSYALVWSPTIGMGVIGAPIASAITYWLMFFSMVVYISCSKTRHAWGSFSLDCIHGITEFYRYAIPSALMMASSWAAYEIVTFCASLFGPVALSAQACIFNLMCLTYQIPSAIGSLAATRIGHSLGNGKHRRARYSSIIAIVLGYGFGICCSTALFVFRRSIGYIYTNDQDVVDMCSTLMPYFAAVQTYDGLNGLVDSLMRSLGKQDLSVYLSIPAFYIIGLPLGYFLGAGPPNMETVGLWIGLALGVTLYSLSQQIYVLFVVDWRQEVKICLERLAKAAPKENTKTHPISSALQSSASLDSYGTIC
ncbi:ethionine resistance protein [Kickxella alabastrina]|uniref:Ethionine resistance protein n=1 Tax=Kickxella alabastrina TaxID=61397 RepID=A0ACC1IQ03_9FUNG|nr:ethionine resistance protein [Kickxella alabastrina]